jgi:NAD-dependent deacetylase
VELPRDLVAALGRVRSLGAITGAGVSAESGIRTYRGRGGLYDDPEEGDRTVEALSGPTLRRDPARTWEVVGALARRSLDAEPNAAHRALVELEEDLEDFVLLTQNVDGLHRAAGSREVIDIHGDVRDAVCTRCELRWRMEPAALRALAGVPTCEACGGGLRPDVVLFGEMLPAEKVRRLQRRLIDEPPELIVVAGTSALFPYIAEPVVRAARRGLPTVEVNPEPTPLSAVVRWSLRGRAGDVLPRMAQIVRRQRRARAPRGEGSPSSQEGRPGPE